MGIIRETISDFQMVEKKEAVLAGVSGGPDSVAMILALLQIREEYGLTLGIAHLNHALRKGESNQDEAFVKHLAKTLDLPFYSKTTDVKSLARNKGLSIEEAGRNARYAFFKELFKTHGYSKIATGHNHDDNAELVLMNLLRGAGVKGLSGIPPKRDNLYIRPLINVSKSQILKFLKREKQNFVIDSSNDDLSFLRNKIRHILLPLLKKEYNPEVHNCLNRTSRILMQENEFMEEQERLSFLNVLKDNQKNLVELFLGAFNDLHPAMKQRVARKAILMVKGDLRRITLRHIQDITHLASVSPNGKSLDLPGQIRVFKSRQTLCFIKEAIPLRNIDRSKS